MEILRAEKIVQWFPPNRRILEEVDLVVQAGESVSVLGGPGSGKTLLMEILSGFRTPSAGRVFVLEKERTGTDRGAGEAFRRKHLGILPRNPGFLPMLTLEENVALPLILKGMPGAKARKLAKERLELLGLRSVRGRLSGQLTALESSLGNMARGTLHGPELVLADEFTADLTEAEEDKVWDLFPAILRQGNMTLIQTAGCSRTAGRTLRSLTLYNGKLEQGDSI